jgi:hypothetical protein
VRLHPRHLPRSGPGENSWLEVLLDHIIGLFHMFVHAGVSHGGPVDTNAVFIAKF